jgi:hypothetical protein
MRQISLSFLAIALLSACSDGDVPVGQITRALQERSDGGPTGDGNSCSWNGTVFHGGATDPALGGPYDVGDEFRSPDDCNDCWCTDRGILCTVLACEDPQIPCTTEALICPDGSAVGRTGPNCEFAPCPGTTPVDCGLEPNSAECPSETVACDDDAFICPDGTVIGRSGPSCQFVCAGNEPSLPCTNEGKVCPDGSVVGRTGPNCEFAPCPGTTPVDCGLEPNSAECPSGGPSECTTEALICPDGSAVGRTGPNCEFAPCPGEVPVACTDEGKICPDGSVVGRTGPNCEFAPCP